MYLLRLISYRSIKTVSVHIEIAMLSGTVKRLIILPSRRR